MAHRGYCSKYPENTLLAIKAAIEECKADGVEFDIHLTKDSQLILQHDDTLDRMTNGSGRVCDHLWHGDIDRLKTKSSDHPNLPVSLFSAVMNELLSHPIIQSRSQPFMVVIDVKDDQEIGVLDVLSKELEAILAHPNANKLEVFIGTWTDEFTKYAHSVMPVGVHFTWIGEEFTKERVQCSLYDSYNIDVDGLCLSTRLLAQKAGKPVLVWTCNTAQQVAVAKAFSVDAILTDDPFLAQ